MAILNLEQVSFFYQSKYQRVQAVKQVSFAFEPGRFYAVMGKSGSGKSSLLALLAGLEMPQEGQVLFQGQPTSRSAFGRRAAAGSHCPGAGHRQRDCAGRRAHRQPG